MKYDILLMQEMGCVSQQHFNSCAPELNGVGVLSLSPETGTRGTSILINKIQQSIFHLFIRKIIQLRRPRGTLIWPTK